MKYQAFKSAQPKADALCVVYKPSWHGYIVATYKAGTQYSNSKWSYLAYDERKGVFKATCSYYECRDEDLWMEIPKCSEIGLP